MQPIPALCFDPVISVDDELKFMNASTSTAVIFLSVSVKSLLSSCILFLW